MVLAYRRYKPSTEQLFPKNMRNFFLQKWRTYGSLTTLATPVLCIIFSRCAMHLIAKVLKVETDKSATFRLTT